VIFRGTFVAHNPALALFGTIVCLCAGVRGVRDISELFAQFISDFSSRKSVKMVDFLDGQARTTKCYT
jgi:hypothetical protein